jgi:N-acetylglutamate synthase-like GNAT family acetyltransferase
MRINIVPYSDRHQAIFKQLNLEWLEKFNLLEPYDLAVLNNPRENVIDAGGVIYLAEQDGEIIGTAALIKGHDDTTYELAKMSVAEVWRGKGISKLLIEACLEKGRKLHATKIILFSNHQLGDALSLYKKYGFESVAVEDSPFTTADVKMELNLQYP